ncbi:MAG: MFS transporter [Burkholderiales bacterium]|nr:MFS transporter [Burkholderiales bacterium]
MNPTETRSAGLLPVAIVLLAGMVAALNIGKLPPSMPALRQMFSLTLVQASYLVSIFQLAGLSLGLFGGLLADRFGPRRVMSVGLSLLALSSGAGAFAGDAVTLLVLRALESAGFILTVLPGPALLRRGVDPARLSWALGCWGCYMPAGMATMMLATPWLIGRWGWTSAWAVCAALAALTLLVLQRVPPDARRTDASHSVARLARDTLGSPGPWWLALCFGLYAGQFIAMFSFLPTVYLAAGISAALAGSLSALGVAVNVLGNLAAGVLLTRGVPRQWLIAGTSLVMAAGAGAAFAEALPFGLRFVAVLCFSAAGGLIPGTLFATAPRFAPHAGAVSTTTGLMQQGSAIGQALSPPLVAAVASGPGGWPLASACIAAFAVANLGAAWAIGRFEARQAAARVLAVR